METLPAVQFGHNPLELGLWGAERSPQSDRQDANRRKGKQLKAVGGIAHRGYENTAHAVR